MPWHVKQRFPVEHGKLHTTLAQVALTAAQRLQDGAIQFSHYAVPWSSRCKRYVWRILFYK